MQPTYPGYQNMVSRKTPDELWKAHAYNLTVYECPADECKLTGVEVYKDGFGHTWTRYRLTWTTHLGYRVYMFSTGCIVL